MPSLPYLFSRFVVQPFFEGVVKRRKTFRYWRELEQSQWLSAAELEQKQLAGLRRLFDHAFRHSNYYREEWARLGLDPASIQSPDDLRRWPLLERDTIRRHRADLQAQLPGMKVLSKSTGGSSGVPLHFDLCLESHERRTA